MTGVWWKNVHSKLSTQKWRKLHANKLDEFMHTKGVLQFSRTRLLNDWCSDEHALHQCGVVCDPPHSPSRLMRLGCMVLWRWWGNQWSPQQRSRNMKKARAGAGNQIVGYTMGNQTSRNDLRRSSFKSQDMFLDALVSSQMMFIMHQYVICMFVDI